MNVIEEVAEGRAKVKWATVRSTYKNKTLVIWVMQDAMKFDGIPALTWNFRSVSKSDPWYTDKTFDGVRLPATALQLQTIADLTGSMMLTPKVIDLIWMQAGLRFDPVINTPRSPTDAVNRTIVAETHIHVVHQEIEKKIAKLGGDTGQLISCTGKYWCVCNYLASVGLAYGDSNACNYGWTSSTGRYKGVSAGVKVWQDPGFRHNHNHFDPSQTIQLMYCKAVLIYEDGREEQVDLHDIASSEYAGLIHHNTGKLIYLRQRGVPVPGSDVAMPSYAPDLSLVA